MESTLKLFNCKVKFHNETEIHEYLCAVGEFEYDEEKALSDESYDLNDTSIFFYFESEEELKEAMLDDGTGEFVVISYEDLNKEIKM